LEKANKILLNLTKFNFRKRLIAVCYGTSEDTKAPVRVRGRKPHPDKSQVNFNASTPTKNQANDATTLHDDTSGTNYQVRTFGVVQYPGGKGTNDNTDPNEDNNEHDLIDVDDNANNAANENQTPLLIPVTTQASTSKNTTATKVTSNLMRTSNDIKEHNRDQSHKQPDENVKRLIIGLLKRNEELEKENQRFRPTRQR
jgi:hypothetical protein